MPDEFVYLSKVSARDVCCPPFSAFEVFHNLPGIALLDPLSPPQLSCSPMSLDEKLNQIFGNKVPDMVFKQYDK